MQHLSSPSFRSAIRAPFPSEPYIQNWQNEQQLTERFLLPALGEVESFFLEIRKRLDPVLSAINPSKAGKPYPLGQCLEITLAVEQELKQLNLKRWGDESVQFGCIALTAFLRAGGTMRRVWGALRGQYFQNAFLVGTLYIDVSNDTVVITKPKVEILPFASVDFKPLADFSHYADIASRYWKAHVFPNHLVPSLAAYCPLIIAIPGEAPRLESSAQYMFALAKATRFRISEAALRTPPMKQEVFHAFAACLKEAAFTVPTSIDEGLSLALKACKQYRAKRWYQSKEHHNAAVRGLFEANKALSKLRVQLISTHI
jgi:hypothetical protein